MKIRMIAVWLTSLALAAAAAGLSPSVASAAKLIAMDGNHGRAFVDEPGAMCYLPNGLNGLRYLITYRPRMYAQDTSAYRDWNWVRFRVRTLNYWTGALASVRPWSEWKVAYDDTAAQFSADDWAPLIANPSVNDLTQWPGNTVSQVEMEWWTQTQRIGGATLQVGSYPMWFSPAAPAGYLQGGYSSAC
jgi:hypothetical protein